MNHPPARTGLPDVDSLIAAQEAERAAFDAMAAANQAEDATAAARRAELLAEQEAAGRRVSAARGLLTKAQKDGNAEKIAAARKRFDAAFAEFDRISEANITEMLALNAVGVVVPRVPPVLAIEAAHPLVSTQRWWP